MRNCCGRSYDNDRYMVLVHVACTLHVISANSIVTDKNMMAISRTGTVKALKLYKAYKQYKHILIHQFTLNLSETQTIVHGG